MCVCVCVFFGGGGGCVIFWHFSAKPTAKLAICTLFFNLENAAVIFL